MPLELQGASFFRTDLYSRVPPARLRRNIRSQKALSNAGRSNRSRQNLNGDKRNRQSRDPKFQDLALLSHYEAFAAAFCEQPG
jgi:hypothetical protein